MNTKELREVLTDGDLELIQTSLIATVDFWKIEVTRQRDFIKTGITLEVEADVLEAMATELRIYEQSVTRYEALLAKVVEL